MLQATVCDGEAFDTLSFFKGPFGSAKVDVGRCDIIDAFMIASIVQCCSRSLGSSVDAPGEARVILVC